MFEIAVVVEANGICPFEGWFDRLPADVADRVDTAIQRMRLGNLGDSRSVGSGVMERRLHVGPGHRIYFGRDGDRIIVLLGGGSKKTQARDIEKAAALWSRYKRARRSSKWP